MITIAGNKITIESTRATDEDKAAFEDAVNAIIDEGYAEVMVDLSMTVYIPSELLGYLMGKKKSLMGAHKDLKITAISESLKRIFDEARISDFLGV